MRSEGFVGELIANEKRRELFEREQDLKAQLQAYVLMTNHVHLLLTPARAARVPALLMSLGQRYVQYVNRSYRRTGTLWNSRYKSSLIDAERYLLTCQRYVELNPVRVGMVDDPAQYAGRAIGRMRWTRRMRGWRRTRCTSRWVRRPRSGRRPIGRCSGRI